MLGDPEDFVMMNDREKYLYDLQGFLVVRSLLAAEEIRALNDALDANLDKTSDPVPPGGLENTALEGDKSPYVHFSGMLTGD